MSFRRLKGQESGFSIAWKNPVSDRRRWTVLSILILASSFALAAAPTAGAQGPPARWTVLVYLDADNNLERAAIDDFVEMASVGSTDDVNVVVQFDRIPGYDYRYGDWTGTLRFRVTQGMTPEAAHAIADLGEANMGDPRTLADFVAWGMATFPAQRTALVIWNHGDGWRTASLVKEGRKAICWDDTNGRDALDAAELRGALADVTGGGGAPLDLLAFDACLMAMIEIDAQLRPFVRVRVASEETEPSTGYPFDTILSDLREHPDWDAAGLGIAIVERYHQAYNGETQSALDLGDGYALLVAAVDDLAGALIAHQDSQFDVVRSVRREVQQFHATYVDLYDLAERLAVASGQGAIQAAAQAVMDAIEAVTLAERHGPYWPGAHGISIYFPAQANGWDSLYAGENDYLAFTAQTRWDDFVMAYLELATACDPDPYEPDGDPTTAAPIQVGDKSHRHNFCPATDTADWVAFEAAAGQAFEITTSGLDAYCDTVLKLYDTDGQALLAQDDDGGVGWASRIEWQSPVTGTYYVQVLEYYGRTGQDTGYTLQVAQKAPPCQPDAYEPDNTPASATTISANGPVQEHNFCPPDDLADWTTFEAVQGETYFITARNLAPEGETMLTLYSTDGTTPLFEEAPQALRWTCPASGPYFIRVHERHGRTGEHTGYTLRLSTLPLTVSGTVHLQGRTTFAGTQVTVQPLDRTVTTAISGTFSLTATVPCTVTAVHASYLATRWVITETTSSELSLGTVTLWGGDINADGRIDILDIAFVGARFGSDDPQADINADGVVDIQDLVLPAANFGRSVE